MEEVLCFVGAIRKIWCIFHGWSVDSAEIFEFFARRDVNVIFDEDIICAGVFRGSSSSRYVQKFCFRLFFFAQTACMYCQSESFEMLE